MRTLLTSEGGWLEENSGAPKRGMGQFQFGLREREET